MIKKLKLGKLSITFVFRHRFEKSDLLSRMEWRMWQLGLFYRHSNIVGRNNFKNPSQWKNNLVENHMFGVELLLCKFWIDVHYNGMELEINN